MAEGGVEAGDTRVLDDGPGNERTRHDESRDAAGKGAHEQQWRKNEPANNALTDVGTNGGLHVAPLHDIEGDAGHQINQADARQQRPHDGVGKRIGEIRHGHHRHHRCSSR